jgi:hypothetical protein
MKREARGQRCETGENGIQETGVRNQGTGQEVEIMLTGVILRFCKKYG